jgi:hypothetical protein
MSSGYGGSAPAYKPAASAVGSSAAMTSMDPNACGQRPIAIVIRDAIEQQ